MDIRSLTSKMEVVDYLRSGALIVAFLAIVVGNRKNRDSVTSWLFAETFCSSAFGLAWLLAPDTVLGYVVSGSLDPVHLMYARVFGCTLLAVGCLSSQSRASSNKAQRIICQLVFLSALLVAMCMAQARSQRDGKQKFSPKHLTFGILSVSLWLLASLINLLRCADLGSVQRSGFLLRSHADIHLFIDFLLCLYSFFLYFGFPTYTLSTVTAKGFKMDLIHVHLIRALGASLLVPIMGYLFAFISGSETDKFALVTSRIASQVSSVCVVAYTLWTTPMFNQTMVVGFYIGAALSLLNMFGAYVSIKKNVRP